MGFGLSIFNPSPYRRGGHVTAPWQPIQEKTGIDPKRIVLLNASDQPLPVQVDCPDESDPSHDTLSFSLPPESIPPGREDYSLPSPVLLRLEEGSPVECSVGESQIYVHNLSTTRDRVEFWNEKLFVSLSLLLYRPYEGKNWYVGSADSVRLDGKEILDAFRDDVPFEHDSEKRCMQVDRLRLWNPAWEDCPFQDVSLFDRPYRLVSQCTGPVRAAVTIAAPFHYDYLDPFTRQQKTLECEFYRVISCYVGVDYVLEELYVKGRWPEKKGGKKSGTMAINLCFSARYFANMDMGFMPEIYRFEQVPDWFAVGEPRGHALERHPGYGFATDVHTASFTHPHPGYPDAQRAWRTFSWCISPSKNAKCLHVFMRGQPAGFDSVAGHRWYEHIFKPLNKIGFTPALRYKPATHKGA